MFRQTTQSDNRGQVGIQTLIIFIALIAVAAITAGILLETANVLQEDADRTGDEASEQVTDRLDVVEVLADTDGENDDDYEDATGDVDRVRLQVSLPAGADAVDLTQTQLSLVTDNQDVLLTHDDDEEFETEALAGEEDEILSDRDQIVEIQVELNELTEDENEDPADLDVSAGDEVDATLRTGAGAETHKSLMVPDPITEDVVSLA